MTSATATPEWLIRSEVGLCPCGCIGKRRKGGFVEKTLGGAANVMRHAMFSDDIAERPGLLQAIDPRVKLVTLFGLLVAAAVVRHIPILVALYLVTLILAVTSGLPLGFFVKRVWLFIPLFTGVVVAPAALNFITHGQIVVPLGSWFGHRAGLTRQGLDAAGLIVTRVAVSISLVVLLTLTTPWNRLLASLRALFVPRMFVLVLGMTYRYVFHLLNGITDMYTARQARTVTRDTDVTKGRAFVAATGGALFGKAHALSEEVHQAMVSRGYTGSHRTLRRARLRAVDALWILACAGCAIAALGVDRVLGH
jgi:cobalt/nickel transport system permease protein